MSIPTFQTRHIFFTKQQKKTNKNKQKQNRITNKIPYRFIYLRNCYFIKIRFKFIPNRSRTRKTVASMSIYTEYTLQ